MRIGQTEGKKKKNRRKCPKMWNTCKRQKTHEMEILERDIREKQKVRRNIWNNNDEEFSYPIINVSHEITQFYVAQRVSSKINARQTAPRHTLCKL